MFDARMIKDLMAFYVLVLVIVGLAVGWVVWVGVPDYAWPVIKAWLHGVTA